jgi:hypothetical protein
MLEHLALYVGCVLNFALPELGVELGLLVPIEAEATACAPDSARNIRNGTRNTRWKPKLKLNSRIPKL